jgi:predicted ATP-grasp superfamily ATP-dependent carboligase
MYPDPKRFPQRFLDFILKISKRNKYEMIMPVGYVSTVTLSKFKDIVERFVKVPVANYAQLHVAARKDETITLAKKISIPIPDSKLIRKTNFAQAEFLKYPCVLKGLTESGQVFYASNPKELNEKDFLRQIEGEFFIAQEYVKGEGYGFFALFNHGEPRAIFMHRRIREYPITGGSSTVAESVYEPKLEEYGLKMLRALNWHGVAMLEFKKDQKDNDFKLMEINPKFWGSLDLAIASGVDFPYLLYRMAVDGDVEPTFNYKRGVKFMWPFPDDFKSVLANPSAFPNFIGNMMNLNVKKNIEFGDLKPNMIQLLETAAILWNGLRNYKQFRYPHGKP